MSKTLLEEKRRLVAQGHNLRNGLSHECSVLNSGYVEVVGGLGKMALLLRAARLVRRLAALTPSRRSRN